MKLGKITVQDMGFETILGALSFERERPQSVRLSFSLWLDFEPIAATDSLNDTVNYAELAKDLEYFVQKSQFILVETLVFRCAERLLSKSSKIKTAWVRVEKPEALPGSAVSSAEIKLERQDNFLCID